VRNSRNVRVNHGQEAKTHQSAALARDAQGQAEVLFAGFGEDGVMPVRFLSLLSFSLLLQKKNKEHLLIEALL